MLSRTNLVILFSLFVAWAFVARFVDHPANMTPIGALVLLAAWYLPRRWGYVVPLVVMIVSDAWLGGYELPVMLSVYGSIAVVTIIASMFRNSATLARMVVGPFFSSTFFFVVTNAAVWAFTPYYAKTVGGLMMSYTLAIPFWRNMFVGDLFYTAVFVGVVAVVSFVIRQPKTTNSQLITHTNA